MALMHNPPHPGETLIEDVLPALGMTQMQAADQLGISRSAFTRVLNGHASISPELAIRLGDWLQTSPEVWAKAQMQYDLWQARKALKQQKVKVKIYTSSRPKKARTSAPRTPTQAYA